MGRIRRSRTHKSIRDNSRKFRTRRYTKDLDQIHEDLKPENQKKFNEIPIDPDLPGLGQFYCIACARHFQSQTALDEHRQNKLHKKRLKLLQEEPYTQKEAEAAVGLTTDKGKQGGVSTMEVVDS
ncbi:uncharacterized protein VTP21DRAFT_999 [Calcarisporiella thermophila]|uniref:uncharacterized protein n=1 Tax=Calcarisporiella thermophila TaxID=911321 RepID=UPI0037434F51